MRTEFRGVKIQMLSKPQRAYHAVKVVKLGDGYNGFAYLNPRGVVVLSADRFVRRYSLTTRDEIELMRIYEAFGLISLDQYRAFCSECDVKRLQCDQRDAALELLSAAQRAGIELTIEQRAKVQALDNINGL